MHNCTIKLPPRLNFPKITIELWTGKYFSRPPPPPKCAPGPHFFWFFFLNPSLGDTCWLSSYWCILFGCSFNIAPCIMALTVGWWCSHAWVFKVGEHPHFYVSSSITTIYPTWTTVNRFQITQNRFYTIVISCHYHLFIFELTICFLVWTIYLCHQLKFVKC